MSTAQLARDIGALVVVVAAVAFDWLAHTRKWLMPQMPRRYAKNLRRAFLIAVPLLALVVALEVAGQVQIPPLVVTIYSIALPALVIGVLTPLLPALLFLGFHTILPGDEISVNLGGVQVDGRVLRVGFPDTAVWDGAQIVLLPNTGLAASVIKRKPRASDARNVTGQPAAGSTQEPSDVSSIEQR